MATTSRSKPVERFDGDPTDEELMVWLRNAKPYDIIPAKWQWRFMLIMRDLDRRLTHLEQPLK